MKLHLPKGLLAVLLSCFVSTAAFTYGTTITLNAGETQSSAPTFDEGDTTLEVNVTGTGVTWGAGAQVNTAVTATVNIEENASLTAGASDYTHQNSIFTTQGTQTINVGAGATLTTNCSLAGWRTDSPVTTTINLGNESVWDVMSANSDQSEYLAKTTINMDGATINVAKNKKIRSERGDNGANKFVTRANATAVSTIQGAGSLVTQNSDITFDVAARTNKTDATEADLVVSTTLSGSGAFIKKGDGVLSITQIFSGTALQVDAGTLNLTGLASGTLTNTGTVNLTNFNGGTLTNEGTLNLTNYKSGTLTNTGTVKFATSASLGSVLSVGGTLDVSEISTLNVEAADWRNFTLSDYSKPESNGYYGGKVTLLSYTGDGTVSIGDITGAGWVKGATISYDGTEKQLQATFAADSGVYCVVSDTDTTTNDALSDIKTTSIVLDNARLGLDSGWDDLKGISSLGGTINIASGASLSSANLQASATTTITGSGRYTTSSMASYGTNVSLSDDWTGNLVISGAAIDKNSNDINGFTKNSSLVTLQGVTGYLKDGDTVAKNLELSKSGTLNGLKINDGYTAGQDDAKLQFTLSGAISGNGDLEIAKGSASSRSPMAYALTGDLSAWTGNFVTSATYGTSKTGTWRTKELLLSGNSGAPEGSDYHAVIGNGIKVTGNGILNVIVSNDNAVLLSGDITRGNGTLNLKVNGSGAKTLGGTVTVNDVTVEAGTLRFTGDKLTVNGSLSIGASTSVENLADPGHEPSSIKFGNAGRIQIAEGGSFTNDGFKYTANGAQATIIGNGVSYLRLHEAGVTVENAVMEKTVNAAKDISIKLTNVALAAAANTDTTTLKGDKQQTLSKVTVGSGSTVKMENTHTDSSIALVEGGGRFETTRNFTGTLAGGADATLTAKLAGTTQTGTVVKVDASVGSVNLLNTSSVTVTDMVIGAGKTVGVYSGDSVPDAAATSNEGKLTVTNLTVTRGEGGAATLNANLTLNGVLTLNDVLTMGSTLTLNSGITLANTGYAHISDITKNTEITLFSSVNSVTYGAASASLTSTEVDAHDVFGNLNTGDFTIRFESGNVILKANNNVPEPATATLSLLALMGLAARRRRKAAK